MYKQTELSCLPCCLFKSELADKNEPNWIRIGVCNWKKGVEKTKNHYKSKQHKNAESARESFLTSRHIDVMLVSGREQELTRRQREVEENKQYLARLADVTETLAKCGLAFRGHDERDSSCNRDNFREVVDLEARWDPTLSRYIANSPRNCTYLSNRSQNDIIQAMEEIVSEM